MNEIYFYDANLLITARVSPLNGDIIRELEPLSDVCTIMLYEGNTELPALLVGKDIIIVNGNLTVTGNIEDCQGVDTSLLIVLGDVTCKNLITLSGIFITGNLHVEHTILGDSLCDHPLKVEGDLKATTILNGGHFFESLGTTTADYIMNTNGSVRDKSGVLKANLADEDLMYDFTENPGSYKGFSYVALIDEAQKSGNYDLPRTIKFIKQGGQAFNKQ
jgi:hypothetical protein